ncbi:kelch-like protein 1 [Episyrphus balteatus]|uniref:kelch-like protein 1 n=1 Tax=Episyrphus balteatus TaxID=286459 RepID=UPI0024868E0C|nr:kelch-like protein 1 [Episyrphus balteatus]XP_055851190.1 kelch-like protein 1 [Episyrphus balteatus]
MYSSSIEVNSENIDSLFETAIFLKIKNLEKGFCDYFEKNINTNFEKYLNIKNCLRWLKLTMERRGTDFQDNILNFVYTNFKEVIQGTEFLLLNENVLKDLLFNKNTQTNLEELVFQSLMNWIEYDKVNRQHLESELLSMVRYKLLSSQFIIKNIKLVDTKVDENYQKVLRWLRYHLSLEESRKNEDQKLTLTVEPKRKINSNEDANPVVTKRSDKTVNKIGTVYLNSKMEIELKSFDEKLNSWIIEKKSEPVPSLKNLKQHSMILIDEKLYIFGGMIYNNNNYNSTKSFRCIDLKTLQWTDLPSRGAGRCDSQLANIKGNICVFGGFKLSDQTLFDHSVLIFNISTQEWNCLRPLYEPEEHNRITVHNGILYIFDLKFGSLQCYDISTNKWTLKELPIDHNIFDFWLTTGETFLYGIFQEKDSIGHCMGGVTIKRFDFSKKSWLKVARIPKINVNSSSPMVTVIGNKILFTSYFKEYKSVEYNLDKDESTFYNLGNSHYDSVNYCIFPYTN